ncbi:hypothetical protein BG011_005132 [Mortierella polycephala]|uniref:Uncharacterized protein n=1 Tax=Mortierella polycephala TaxID=41804 RepID=A0A9P6QCD4_9FUNG|nr:hypothetical protein BG011_005132 [Mortierella polycephala]
MSAMLKTITSTGARMQTRMGSGAAEWTAGRLQRTWASTTASLLHRPCSSPLRVTEPVKAGFSTSAFVASAIEKKPLSKKITLPKDPYLLSEKVLKFARSGKLDDAITLVMEAPKSRQNEVVWNQLIQESSKVGKSTQSWRLLNEMKKRGFEPSDRTFTILLNSLAINSSSPNSISRAMELYKQMQDSEDTPPTLVHTNALLKVCSRKPDYEALQQVYNDMPKTGSNAPDVVTFNILINSFARMGGDRGFKSAWKVWEDFLEAKIKRPDQVELDQKLVDAILLACREAVSSTYIKRGYPLIESLYGLSVSPSSSQPGPSKTSSASERAILPSKSLGLGAILRKDSIHPRTVELLLSICSKLRDHDKAQQYMDLIRSTYPDFKPDPQLLSSLMHLQITTKQYETAIATWDEIDALGLQHTPNTFKQGLDASHRARNWTKGFEMYSKMRELIQRNKDIDTTHHRPINPIVRQLDAWSLVSILSCAVKTKHINEALIILDESQWKKVLKNSQYPRANADLAFLAVKIYTSALKSSKSASGSLEADSHEARLETELSVATTLKERLDAVLGEHDKNKARKGMEDKPSRKTQYRSVPTVTSDTFEMVPEVTEQRHVRSRDSEYANTRSWRPSGQRYRSAESNEPRKSNYNGPKRNNTMGKGRSEDPFSLTKSFKRDFHEQ